MSKARNERAAGIGHDADDVLAEIDAIFRAKLFEARGAFRKNAFAGVRRFVMNKYLVDYEVLPEVINIIAIRHGRQLPPNQSNDPTMILK